MSSKTLQIAPKPPTIPLAKPGPQTQVKNGSYSFYTVRRKGEVHPTQVIAVDDPQSSYILNFLKRNPDWERCKVTISLE